MRAVHTVLIAAALAMASPAFAQLARLETQMSAVDFNASGLDKLSEAELARLNDWLAQRAAGTASGAAPVAGVAASDVEARIAQAREEGRLEAASDTRGIVAAPASREPIESTITGQFEGFAQGRQYTLANGQIWRQTDGTRITGARGNDVSVRIRPGFMNMWWMKVGRHNTEAKVERIK